MKYIWVLMIICVVVIVYLYIKRKPGREAFQQEVPFSVKTDADIYDEFYCDIYDKLMVPDKRVAYETDLILRTLNPNIETTRILDVGSGTGSLVGLLKEKGYNAKGVDKSQAMVSKGLSNGHKEIILGDVGEPMLFDRADFTIILCLDFTIYEMTDKVGFFKNAYYWLERGGYLVVHLADKDRFNAIIPGAKPAVLDSIEQLGPKRVKKTVIDFGGFEYTSDYICGKGCEVVHKESFVDKVSQNVRQNELTLYMETGDEIIEMARGAGFIPFGAFTMVDGPAKDAAQQIVIFQRGS